MNFPTEGTWVNFNGKKYLLMPGGNVRLSVKRNGQFYDKWFSPDTKIAQNVRNEWAKA